MPCGLVKANGTGLVEPLLPSAFRVVCGNSLPLYIPFRSAKKLLFAPFHPEWSRKCGRNTRRRPASLPREWNERWGDPSCLGISTGRIRDWFLKIKLKFGYQTWNPNRSLNSNQTNFKDSYPNLNPTKNSKSES